MMRERRPLPIQAPPLPALCHAHAGSLAVPWPSRQAGKVQAERATELLSYWDPPLLLRQVLEWEEKPTASRHKWLKSLQPDLGCINQPTKNLPCPLGL